MARFSFATGVVRVRAVGRDLPDLEEQPAMRVSVVLFVSLSAALAAAGTARAQQLNNAGLGAVKRMFDASAAGAAATSTTAGNVRLTGAAYLNGFTYVGSDDASATMQVYDPSGTMTRFFSAPSPTNDLANDGQSILGSSPTGIWVFDTNGVPVNTVNAQNGPQAIANPIAGPALAQLGAFRGLAFHAAGNGGNGSFFVGNVNATDPILEIDLAGNVLGTFPNLGWLCSGLARDPVTGNLWCMNGQTTSTSTSPIIELDAGNNLTPTGQFFDERWNDQGFQGGLDIIPGGDAGSYPSHVDLVSLTRLNGPDWLVYHRLHLVNGVLGYDEPFLEGAVNLNPVGRGVRGNLGQVADNDLLSWNLNPGTGACNNCPGLLFLAVGPDAARTGVTTFFNMWEVQVLWPLSMPSSASLFILPFNVGGPSVAVSFTPGILSCFELVRLQGAYVELNATPPQIVATNELFVNAFDEASCDIVVEAVGANTFNADTTSGFWRVLHKGGPGIQSLELDFGHGTNPDNFDIHFDTDNPNMADVFDGGNSTAAGCAGTYRNNSHVTTGLIFDGANTLPSATTLACNPLANTGWIGFDSFGGNPGSYRGLRFRFTSFSGGTPASPVVFEFDADTDNGVGTNGFAMAGCIVRVVLTNGQVRETELRADPVVADRSVGGF